MIDPLSNEEYQDLANHVTNTTLRLIQGMHVISFGPADGNGAPIIQGVMTALLSYTVKTDMADDAIKAMVLGICDETLPQIRMAIAAEGLAGGRA